MTTPWTRRIIPFGTTIAAVVRSFWYLRTFLLVLAGALLLNALGLWLTEAGGAPTAHVRPPASFAASLYLAGAAACSLDTGDLGAVTRLGRVILLIDSVLGLLLLGIVVWVVQFCLGANPLRASRHIFFASEREASLK